MCTLLCRRCPELPRETRIEEDGCATSPCGGKQIFNIRGRPEKGEVWGRQPGLSLLRGKFQVHFLLTLSSPAPTSFPISDSTLIPAGWPPAAAAMLRVASLPVPGVVWKDEPSGAPWPGWQAPAVSSGDTSSAFVGSSQAAISRVDIQPSSRVLWGDPQGDTDPPWGDLERARPSLCSAAFSL